MKRILLSGVALAAFATGPALAADLPARMPVKAPVVAPIAYNWSGFYIGGHAGGGWGEKCFTFVGVSDGCHDNDGWLAGGQIGYNWHTGTFLLGLELSGSWSRLEGSHATLIPPTGIASSELNGILMFTGRVGLTWDRVLAYVTGGAAWAREEFAFASGALLSTADENRWGWTVGAGLEFAVTPNWSIAAQYNYIDFGDEDHGFTGTAGNFTYGIDQHVHLGTVRLNYRWGGPVVARY